MSIKKDIAKYDFSGHPNWAIARPVDIDLKKYNVIHHTPWKKPPPGEEHIRSNKRRAASGLFAVPKL